MNWRDVVLLGWLGFTGATCGLILAFMFFSIIGRLTVECEKTPGILDICSVVLK